jgi:tRNA(fMet)-specific endonuclease VapC
LAYLVDTIILIYHLNGIENATQLIDRLLEPGAAMSSISYMEVVEGLEGRRGPVDAERRFTELAERLRILDFRREDAVVAARVRHVLREQGRNVRARGLDLLIASTALSNDLTLATNNPSDYQDVPGLRLEVEDLHV